MHCFRKKKCPKIYGQKVKIPTIWKVGKATYHTRTGIYAGFFFHKKGSLEFVHNKKNESYKFYSICLPKSGKWIQFERFQVLWPI